MPDPEPSAPRASERLEKLERDLRTLFPVAVALAYRERWPQETLVSKLVRVTMTCITGTRAQ